MTITAQQMNRSHVTGDRLVAAFAEGRTTAAASIMRELTAAGISHCFGIPGGALAGFVDALGKLKSGAVSSVLAGHETDACTLAEGAVRGTGRIQACYVTAGPGAAQLPSALASTCANQIPMFVIAAEPPLAQSGRDPAQALDVLRLLDNPQLAKICERVADPRQAAARARHILHVASSGVPGPGILILPADVGLAEVDEQEMAPAPSFRQEDAVALLYESLKQGRPMGILVGSGGARAGAGQAAIELAELLACPIATTARAKSTIPETHELAVGPWGFSSTAMAEAAIGERAQILVVVGSRGGELSSGGYDPRLRQKQIIQIDCRAERLGANFPIAVGIAADARAAVEYLCSELKAAGIRHEPRGLTGPHWLKDDAGEGSVPLKPQRLVSLVNRLLPQDMPIFVDIGTCMMWAISRLVRTVPNTFHWDGHFGRMGHSCAGIGAAIATERPAVILTGDAALKMVLGELHTAAEYGARITVVVLNDSGHGMVECGLKQGRLSSPGYRFRQPLDYQALGQASGCRAFRIETEEDFLRHFPAAITGNGPTVLDVIIDPEEVPPMERRLRALRAEVG